MVLCVEGNHPGLCRSHPSPAPRRFLCGGQQAGQMLSALNCDLCGLDRCIRTQCLRYCNLRDAISSTRARLVHRYHRLVHRHHVYADNLPHQSLCGSFMAKLSRCTRWPSAEARSVAKCSRHSIAHRTPALKSARATATVTYVVVASSDAPALTQDPLPLQIPDSRVPLAPAAGPVYPGLPVPTRLGHLA